MGQQPLVCIFSVEVSNKAENAKNEFKESTEKQAVLLFKPLSQTNLILTLANNQNLACQKADT